MNDNSPYHKHLANGQLSEVAYNEDDFPALRLTRSTRMIRRLGRVLITILFIAVIAAVFAPWQQSLRGEGSVIAFDPFERPQPVKAPIKGLIAERGEGIQENAYVEKGQLLFRIQDQDPLKLVRLEQQVDAAKNELDIARMREKDARALRDNNETIVGITEQGLEALTASRDELLKAYDRFIAQAENKLAAQKTKLDGAEAAFWQAELDWKRQTALYKDGIASGLKQQASEQKYLKAKADVEFAKQEIKNAENALEGKKLERNSTLFKLNAGIQKEQSALTKAMAEIDKAEIDIKKTQEEINAKDAKLRKIESEYAVQQTQDVTAPRSGFIMNLTVIDGQPVKASETLCRIVPETKTPAVQVWVAGNDAPLIAKGDHVRLQFEGWPAVQFSGWPSVAVGTFGGTVALVDPTDDGMGRFRVVVIPDPEDRNDWPEYPYLRQGVRANAWVLLETVPLGYEVWRRMNGFPPALESKIEKGGDKSPKPPKIKI